MKATCEVHLLGRMPYELAWKLQESLAGEIAQGNRPATLLLLEHPHTYTFGRSGCPENLLWDEQELALRGINVYWVDRGGDITYHGPGQLVGYPLLPLAPGGLNAGKVGSPSDDASSYLPQADYVGYVRKLEAVLILALAHMGISSQQIRGLTGVWAQPEEFSRSKSASQNAHQKPAKIAAIGVKVDVKGVSRHGFAINVNPDMSYWEGIIGCGLKDHPVASIADLINPPPTLALVSDLVVAAFGEVFQYEMVEASPGSKSATEPVGN